MIHTCVFYKLVKTQIRHEKDLALNPISLPNNTQTQYPLLLVCLLLHEILKSNLLYSSYSRIQSRSSIFYKSNMTGQSKEAVIPPWGLAVAGATGAVIANAMVYPLDM